MERNGKMKKKDIIKNGIFTENPTFVQLLGMCPTLAVTSTLKNGIGMGLSATAVLVISNVIISLLRKCIPEKIRIAAYIVIIATAVTIIQMLLNAYFPDLASSLGIFIPLIVVNCIILARAESFASKNTVSAAAADGIGMGLGFTIALSVISAVREILGSGTIWGFELYGGGVLEPMSIVVLAPGGFIVLGIIIAIKNMITDRKADDKNA